MARRDEKRTPMINLKLMRIRKGFTLKQLADAAGVNYNTISQYENGIYSPRMKNLEAIAKALGCEICELL